MRWADESSDETAGYDSDVVDVAYRLSGRWLPVDHAQALRDAVTKFLPWLEDEPSAGIHSIHVAASGNGWERPDRGADGMLALSRRTPLVLRVPTRRAADADALGTRRLDVEGCELFVGTRQRRPLRPARTAFARYVVDDGDDDEERFTAHIAAEMEMRGITVRKLLCGRSHRIETVHGALTARSVLIADLGRDESLELQCRGIGRGPLLGCGLFVPHKDIGPVGDRIRDG